MTHLMVSKDTKGYLDGTNTVVFIGRPMEKLREGQVRYAAGLKRTRKPPIRVLDHQPFALYNKDGIEFPALAVYPQVVSVKHKSGDTPGKMRIRASGQSGPAFSKNAQTVLPVHFSGDAQDAYDKCLQHFTETALFGQGKAGCYIWCPDGQDRWIIKAMKQQKEVEHCDSLEKVRQFLAKPTKSGKRCALLIGDCSAQGFVTAFQKVQKGLASPAMRFESQRVKLAGSAVSCEALLITVSQTPLVS